VLLGLILGVFFVSPLVLVYFLFIRWCDRFEPEPWWLLTIAFFFGAIFATLGGGISSMIAGAITQNVMGLAESSDEMKFITTAVWAPVFEEMFKGFGVLLIAGISWLGVKELDGPLDGAIYGGVVGLGFTLTEDVLYVSGAFAQGGAGGFVVLWFIRTVLGGLGHATYTAMTGLGVGWAAESKSIAVKIFAPMGGYFLAVLLHGFHNGILALGIEGFLIMLFTNFLVDAAFFLILFLLVVRDRKIVLRELAEEVGNLLHPQELQLITTYVTIGWRNWGTFFSKGWTPFRMRRRKQLALVEIAFIKSRRRRGEKNPGLDQKEAKLRHEVALANHHGVWLG
jgi:RsiW-degrading membrane proteinase PrsW (M82 family)